MSLLTSDYISSWYFIKRNNNPGQSGDVYYLLKSITNTSTTNASPKDLIQGEAGTLVIDQTGQTEQTNISSDALVLDNSYGSNNVETLRKTYYDVIDLFLYDYYLLLSFFFLTPEDINNSADLDWFNKLLEQFNLTINNKNLLASATINVGTNVTCDLEYLTRYDHKFDIVYNDLTTVDYAPYDFIARTARNYDCRFFIDGNQYKIKEGSINIKIDYKDIYIANTKSKLPFYSPQSYSVTGSITILAKHDEFDFIGNEGNCSLLVGNRYIELGQGSLKTQYTRSLNAENSATTITIQFTGYARLGAGIDGSRWNTYYLTLLQLVKDNNSNNYITVLNQLDLWLNSGQ
jgi:hypothetical protein